MEDEKNLCSINWKYVPIKAHYFFLFGGMGGALPYIQVFAKDFGISPTAVGIIYTIVPLCICLAKPIFGFITDKLQNFKAIILLLLLAVALAFYSILYIPPIKNSKVGRVEVTAMCKDYGGKLIITPPTYDVSCAKEIKEKQFDCSIASNACLRNQTLDGALNVTNVLTGKEGVSLAFTFMHNKTLYNDNCDCLKQNFSYMTCEPNFYRCSSFENPESPSEYTMYNFWIFVLLAVIAGAGTATVFCLTDAACYEILSDNPRQYGKQRLWATISWGLATLTSGYLNDIATSHSKDRTYSPGFHLMLVFVAVDMLILSRIELKKTRISSNICRDISTIFSSVKTIVFSFGVYVCGTMTGLLWTYHFWYLTELGATQLLLGLVAGVQCLVAEVPFFFFSGWFIKKFGHFYCLTASLCAFALRIGLYSILTNPWMVLPIEVLHGITYAIFCAAMTLYAVDCAPPGTEATMLGILGGIFEGLGVATGSFLGGLGFDNMGGRWTFFVASMVSLVCVPIFTVAYKLVQKSEDCKELEWDSFSDGLPSYGATEYGEYNSTKE